MNGKPGTQMSSNQETAVLKAYFGDTLKGSYYANINPAFDKLQVSSAQYQNYPEYYGNNICACWHQN